AAREGGEAGAFPPVLRGRGAAVVRGAAVRQDGGEPGAAGVPGAGAAGEHGAVPAPGQPSSLVAYAVLMRSSAPGTSSGWQHSHACHVRPSWRITGSFTPVRASPGKTVRTRAVARPSGDAASSTPIHQCLVPGVAQLTYSRQRPDGVRTRAGRSTMAARK